jgi:hypothetical protein
VQGGGPAKCTLPSAGARSSSVKRWLSIVCLCEPHVASHCGSCEQGWYKPVRVSTEQEVDQNDFNSWKYMLVARCDRCRDPVISLDCCKGCCESSLLILTCIALALLAPKLTFARRILICHSRLGTAARKNQLEDGFDAPRRTRPKRV